MYVYHGTSKALLGVLEVEGVASPSYWTDNIGLAREYASSHGDGVVLRVLLADYEFKANMLVADCLLENGDLEESPAMDDLEFSLANLEGIVCHDRIRTFEVLS